MLIAERYETLQLLGTGGMGEVYLTLDRSTGLQVALKLLKEDVSADLVTRFDRERELLERVRHPAVVHVLDRGESEGRVFYTMDYIAWPTLSQRMADKARAGARFTVDETRRLLESLAGALDHIHGLGVVHRDLKPSNLLVSDELECRVIDFGLVGMMKDRMTRTGAILGSMLYLSPEQVRADKSLDTRSDVFQLGLVLYEMLSGRKAYSNVVTYVKMLRSGQVPFSAVHVVEPSIPEGVGEAVMRALAIDPEERPASAGELAKQFAAGETSRPEPRRASRVATPAAKPLPSKPMTPVRPPPRAFPAVPLGLAATGLIAAAAFFWFAGRTPAAAPTGLEVTHGFFRTEMRWSSPAPCSVKLSREGETDLVTPASGDRTHVVTFADLEPSASYRAQILVGDRPAGPALVLQAPARPGVSEVRASALPSGTLVSFRTTVPSAIAAGWKGASGEIGSIGSEKEPVEDHRLELAGFRPRGPFRLDLRCVSRLGEVWTTRVDSVEAR